MCRKYRTQRLMTRSTTFSTFMVFKIILEVCAEWLKSKKKRLWHEQGRGKSAVCRGHHGEKNSNSLHTQREKLSRHTQQIEYVFRL